MTDKDWAGITFLTCAIMWMISASILGCERDSLREENKKLKATIEELKQQ